jgi:5-methylcytosine-specific restriction endonuclease McrA
VRARGASKNNYHLIFFAYNGPGPHLCHHCHEEVLVPWLDEQVFHLKMFHIHHLDGNHDNNDPANLVPVHSQCHGFLHRDSDLTRRRKSLARKNLFSARKRDMNGRFISPSATKRRRSVS